MLLVRRYKEHCCYGFVTRRSLNLFTVSKRDSYARKLKAILEGIDLMCLKFYLSIDRIEVDIQEEIQTKNINKVTEEFHLFSMAWPNDLFY